MTDKTADRIVEKLFKKFLPTPEPGQETDPDVQRRVEAEQKRLSVREGL